MTKTKLSWYQEPDQRGTEGACGWDGNIPCSELMEADGSIRLLHQTDSGDSKLEQIVDQLADEVNDFFDQKAKKLLKEIRESDQLPTADKDRLEIRMVMSNKGARLVLATCMGRPDVDLEAIIKAGKKSLNAVQPQQ